MTRFVLRAGLALIALCCAPPAFAQVFGQYTGAQTLAVNERLFTAHLHTSSDVVGLVGQLRLSFYPNVDFGFQGGVSRIDVGGDERSMLRLGADFKVLAMRADQGLPVDVAVGAAIGSENGDDFSVLTIAPSVVASRTFPMGGTSTITPYLGALLSFANYDVGGVYDDTDLSLPLRMGADFRVMDGFRISGEIQLRLSDDFSDDSAIAVGVNLPF